MTDEEFLPAFAKASKRYGFELRDDGFLRGRDEQCPITAVFQASRKAAEPVGTMFAYYVAAKLGLSVEFSLAVMSAADGVPGAIHDRLVGAMRGQL